ncbi:MAG: chemotaxis protein CheA [Thermonemataceae bacterium]
MNEDELREVFLAEAQEQQDQLNQFFIALEQNQDDKKVMESIFRITHTLKANAAGLGFKDLAALAHALEDIFSAIKKDEVEMDDSLFNDLFRANDVMAAMLLHIQQPDQPKPKFRGIKTKLEVFLRNLRKKEEETPEIASPDTITIFNPPTTQPEETKATTKVEKSTEATSATEKTTKKTPKQEILAEETAVVTAEEELEDITNKITFSDSIHIPIKKLDALLNLVGELIIEKDRVVNVGLTAQQAKRNDYIRLQRITSELQYAVMDIRLIQIGILFSKFHRIVRDVASAEGKQVNLVLEGSEIEIDRNILQIISDSLVHLVRNAISHGIGTEDERINMKKPARGTITLHAESIKEEVRIIVEDNGRGLDLARIRQKVIEKKLLTQSEVMALSDEAVTEYIFEPGFSSVDTVTDISGRGVGMDVVKRAVDSVGGKIQVETTPLVGTKIILTLPSSMAVKGALLFDLNQTTYAIPLSYTNAVTSITKRQVKKVNKGLVTNFLDKSISVVFLKDLFSIENLEQLGVEDTLHRTFDTIAEEDRLDIVVVNYNHREVGFVVDKLYQQKEIVEKSLGVLLKQAHFISGATILGDGEVCLVLDAPSLMNTLFKNYKLQRN